MRVIAAQVQVGQVWQIRIVPILTHTISGISDSRGIHTFDKDMKLIVQSIGAPFMSGVRLVRCLTIEGSKRIIADTDLARFGELIEW
jgi:hypothetical protein